MSNKRGSITVTGYLLIAIVVSALLEVNEIKKAVFQIMEEQNKKDAHMLSVISLYRESLDTVTWCNKQLKRLGLLALLMKFIPGAEVLAPAFNSIGKGLTWYQDFIMVRLRIYAPVLDLTLRKKNSLSLLCNIHTVNYRRRTGMNFLGLFSIPPLLELRNDIFTTACVRHKGVITNISACIDHKEYRNEKSKWFAPVDGVWEVSTKNAY